MSRLRILFRVDASIQVGTGHIMRCLTLADELAKAGAQIRFLCRDLEGHLGRLIEERGYALSLLPRPEDAFEPDDAEPVEHAAWLGVDWQTDARECRPLVEEFQPDWIVLDHYALDARWEEVVRPARSRLLVIDDLADRRHISDVLLDANLGRNPADYAALVPENCVLLTGPSYALLRPEFREARQAALARREKGSTARLLVSLGGVDRSNVTGKVLDALAEIQPASIERIAVVLGHGAPWIDDIGARAAAMPIPTEVIVNASNMAELMTDADFCIGAAGTTSWERCCLGLPTLVIILAGNQLAVSEGLERKGAALSLGWFDADFKRRLQTALVTAVSQDWMAGMSHAAAAVTDGYGTSRTMDTLRADEIRMRQATIADAPAIWHWRYDGDAARYYRNTNVPSIDEHLNWFREALKDKSRRLLVAERLGEPIAHVRIDHNEPDAGEVGICLSPNARGKNLSAPILAATRIFATKLGLNLLTAEVHRNNVASRQLFFRAGYSLTEIPDSDFIQFHLKIQSSGDEP